MNDYAKISGFEKIEGVEILYLQKTEKYDFFKIVNAQKPLLATKGGVVEDGCFIITPEGDMFFSVQYHLDIEGWRNQLKRSAELLHILVGWIDKESFILSDGRSYLLRECKVTTDFKNHHKE